MFHDHWLSAGAGRPSAPEAAPSWAGEAEGGGRDRSHGTH